jgi:hypothetical protein
VSAATVVVVDETVGVAVNVVVGGVAIVEVAGD